jgi:hypothetical protein
MNNIVMLIPKTIPGIEVQAFVADLGTKNEVRSIIVYLKTAEELID